MTLSLPPFFETLGAIIAGSLLGWLIVLVGIFIITALISGAEHLYDFVLSIAMSGGSTVVILD